MNMCSTLVKFGSLHYVPHKRLKYAVTIKILYGMTVRTTKSKSAENSGLALIYFIISFLNGNI